MNKHQRGAQVELQAAAYYIEQGYEVFRNVVPVGPVDLVIMNDQGVIRKIEVKAASNQGYRSGRKLSPKQTSLGVELVYFHNGKPL